MPMDCFTEKRGEMESSVRWFAAQLVAMVGT